MSRKPVAVVASEEKSRHSGKRRGRPSKNNCCALIPLDTTKIRKEYLKKYKRQKKVLDKLKSDLQSFEESDMPEFEKFLARNFGAEQTREREMTQKIFLCQSRYEKIRFLARENGMSKERYCFSLKTKITPDFDFWSVLGHELYEFQELEKKNLAEMRRAMKNMAESQGDEYLDDEEDWEDWDNFYDWDDFGGDGFGDVGNKSLRELFGGNAEKLKEESGERSLKKLYRELCLRYHPDRFGTHDAKTKRLWIEIQEAYQDGDINQLRTIHAGIEIESGKSELNCSEIDDLICDLELSIKEKRDQIRNCKSAPFWGFAGWQEIKRRKISKEIKFEYERSHQQNEKKLRQLESELERLLNSYKPKSKPSKKVIQKQEVNKQTPDLFGDLFAEI